MPNITLSIDEKLLEAGRLYAHEHGTTLNALVRDLLAHAVIRKSGGRLEDSFRKADRLKTGSKGLKWRREDAYDG
jgi:hypothetical protein